MDPVCISAPELWTGYITAAITAFSMLANILPDPSKATGVGKVLSTVFHWLALNITVKKS